MLLLGVFATIRGVYAAVLVIVGQFQAGTVARPFQCADNSDIIVAEGCGESRECTRESTWSNCLVWNSRGALGR